MRSNDGPPESVGDLLNRYSVGMIAKSNLRTLGMRLSEAKDIRLEMIAAHYGVPRSHAISWTLLSPRLCPHSTSIVRMKRQNSMQGSTSV